MLVTLNEEERLYKVFHREYGLKQRELEIFYHYYLSPLRSPEDIGKFVGVTGQTVRNKLSAMRQSGFLRPRKDIMFQDLGKRSVGDNVSVVDMRALGLQTMHLHLTDFPDETSFEFVYEIFSYHPYISYIAKTHERGQGIYAEMNLPPDAILHVKNLVHELSLRDMLGMYFLLDDYAFHHSPCNFNSYDQEKERWTSSGFGDVKESASPEIAMSEGGRRVELDATDILVLQELSINANPKLSVIAEVAGKSIPTISRRIQRLRAEVISRNQVIYDTRVFNLTMPLVVTGRFSTVEMSEFMAQMEAFSFETYAAADHEKFLLVTLIPPYFLAELQTYLYRGFREVRCSFMQLSSARRYHVLPMNYIEKNLWRSTKDYVVDLPVAMAERNFERKKL